MEKNPENSGNASGSENGSKWSAMVVLALAGLVVLLAGIAAFYFVSGGVSGENPIYLYLLISVAGAIVAIAVIFAVLAAKGKLRRKEPDYRTLFIIGISWIPIGIATGNYAFLAMGLALMGVGLMNRKKWKKQPKWSEMPPAERKFKLAAVIILGAMVVLGFALWMLVGR